MGLLRSEFMKYGMLVIPVQDARRYIDKIGRETNIQFEDMNAREMRRPYRKHVQRIDEMERILRFMYGEMEKIEGCEVIKNKFDEFLLTGDAYKLDKVEAELSALYANFMRFKDNNVILLSERSQALEEHQVVTAAMKIMGASVQEREKKSALEEDLLGGGRLGNIAGVVPSADEARFGRAIWRASRGNTFTEFTRIEEQVLDPKTGLLVQKSVFIIYFQGAAGAMKDKVLKVCNAFGVNLYNWPGDSYTALKRDAALRKTLAEKDLALGAYQEFLRGEVKDLIMPSPQNTTGNSKIEDYRLFAIKEKSLYTILNMCEGDMLLRVNVWYPAADEGKVKALLQRERELTPGGQGALLNEVVVNVPPMKPTYIRTNEYTEAWQELIDTYGIPRYQEANPGLFTVVTFPFIFGMMYGDVGHGSMLLLAGIYLVMNAESLRFTQPVLYTARYMVLSMGVFATYAGFMYNDFFSVGLQLFSSGYEDREGNGFFTPTYDVKNEGGPGPYPFGLDWAWHGASNELLYVNSMKMKLSVLFGVVQMTFGLLLRWSNAVYERNMVDFFCECIPMMVFMLCFFGWMDVMILYKWTHPIDDSPNIINSLICMAMGQKDNNPLWPGSVELAQSLMVYTALSVPIMLLPKPFIELFLHNRQIAKNPEGHMPLHDEEAGGHSHGHGHGEEFKFDEILIHQIIETIEYVLGTVSHTASYLRIWALSLAHQQLSLVFFQKTLTMGLTMAFPMNGIVMYIMFAAWFGITCGVLLGMDVLECFLHTLRLHWVEFQSKFYKAGGEKFSPFNIRKLIDTAE